MSPGTWASCRYAGCRWSDRDKRLVGILSLADVAAHEKDGRRVGNALREIAQPGGKHNQGDEERARGM